MKNILNATNIILVVLIACVIGLYFKIPTKSQTVVTAGAVGDTNSTSRIAQIVMDMTTTTPASLYNGDTRDRIISSIDYYAAALTTVKSNGTGLAAFTLKMSTSTNVYTPDSTNYVLNTTVATTTPQLFVGSTTPGMTDTALSGAQGRVWAAGTYLNAFGNGTSTATATIVIRYFTSQ